MLPSLLRSPFRFLNLLPAFAYHLPQCDAVQVPAGKETILLGCNVEPAICPMVTVNPKRQAPNFLIAGHRQLVIALGHTIW